VKVKLERVKRQIEARVRRYIMNSREWKDRDNRKSEDRVKIPRVGRDKNRLKNKSEKN
jgi:hypothetical protein